MDIGKNAAENVISNRDFDCWKFVCYPKKHDLENKLFQVLTYCVQGLKYIVEFKCNFLSAISLKMNGTAGYFFCRILHNQNPESKILEPK